MANENKIYAEINGENDLMEVEMYSCYLKCIIRIANNGQPYTLGGERVSSNVEWQLIGYLPTLRAMLRMSTSGWSLPVTRNYNSPVGLARPILRACTFYNWVI